MPDAAYFRAWRRQNPEYMQRERERSRSRSRTPEQRRAERERAKARKARRERERAYDREWIRRKRAARTEHDHNVEKIVKRFKARLKNHVADWRGEKRHQAAASRARRGRRWMEDAERIVSSVTSRDDRTVVYDPLYEDAVSECLVLLMRHRHTHKDRRERIVAEEIRRYIREERRWRWYAQGLLFDPQE